MTAYLPQLTIRLSAGIGELPEATRARHAVYLLSQQRSDGGFAGREGGSDLYYTGFALRALAILGELQGPVAEKSAEFLVSRLRGRESVVDFLSLIYGAMLLESAAGIDVFAAAPPAWRDSVATALERLRRDDGGYAKGPEGVASSTYYSFLVRLCQELIERPTPQPERLIAFVLSQKSDEGGFREIRASKRAGTNPTAAAIGLLRTFAPVDPALSAETTEFLLDMQNDEGGWRANTRIPIADLLSTFTSLLTLQDLHGAHEADLDAARKFALSLELPTGGFLAAAWDSACDIEYTFYGLGTLALLSGPP